MSRRSHEFSSPPVRRLIAKERELRGAVIARAPGRLDVMGGIADYTGSRVCPLPLTCDAAVAVAPRDDERIVCLSAQTDEPWEGDVECLGSDDPARFREAVVGWARYLVGCVWWLERRATLPRGLTIQVDSDVPLGGGVSSSAAIEVATMTALCGLVGFELEPIDLAAACQEVENQLVGAPCGVMDQAAAHLGRAGHLLELSCRRQPDGRPARVLGFLPLPEGWALVGIHSGVRHEVTGDPYTDTRVAAFIADRILAELGCDVAGVLADVPLDRYEQELRARLPEMLSGAEFLARHGATRDPVTQVRAERSYRVRAAADHHVREAHRVERFVAAVREGDLEAAGALLGESHESYGRNAGLGHPLTDRLAALLRETGLPGSRITGGGSGGVVAVLLRDDAESHSAIERVRERYTAETGRTTDLFAGSSDGAATTGFLRLEQDHAE